MSDEASGTRDKRSGVIIRATIAIDGTTVERRVRNLSRRGACIDHDGELTAGQSIGVSMGILNDLKATVMWVRPTLAGLRFDDTIDLDAARRPRAITAGVQTGWMTDIRHAYRARS